MTDSTPILKSQIESIFSKYDTNNLRDYNNIISTKYDNRILQPYLPHIGKEYPKYSILLYGTAQNYQESRFNEINSVNFIHQLSNIQDYNKMLIAPYRIMLSLAGLLIYLKTEKTIESFQDIHNSISASNYYKFSLNHGKKDINPNNLPKSKYNMFFEANDYLTKSEVDILEPKIIISFKGRQNGILKNKDYTVLTINDPAWILRGGSGVLKEGKSWHIPNRDLKADKLITSYLDQIDADNDKYKNKRKSAHIYLYKYYNDWKKMLNK